MNLHFPHVIDSTILSTFRSCPQKAFRQYFQHWKPKGESVHLVAGGAFAKGIEIARREFFENGKSKADAEAAGLEALIRAYGTFDCPPDSAKSCERTAGALEFYFDKYPFGVDNATPIAMPGTGRRGIEFSFSEPIDIVHPETGNPIIYSGSCDMIADFAGGVYGFDEKTTSSLGASWPKQWEMRSQFTGYCWGMRQNGIAAQGMIVRGVSILKTKYDTMQVVSSRSEYEVDRWYKQVLQDVNRMLRMFYAYKEEEHDLRDVEDEPSPQHFDYNLDHACAEYGGCSFVPVCKSPSPERWLPMYFDQKVWDPLTRTEISPEENQIKWTGKAD